MPTNEHPNKLIMSTLTETGVGLVIGSSLKTKYMVVRNKRENKPELSSEKLSR